MPQADPATDGVRDTVGPLPPPAPLSSVPVATPPRSTDVMAGLAPAIHASPASAVLTAWMAGPRPAMTTERGPHREPDSRGLVPGMTTARNMAAADRPQLPRAGRMRTITSTRAISMPAGGCGRLSIISPSPGMSITTFSFSTKKWWWSLVLVSK